MIEVTRRVMRIYSRKGRSLQRDALFFASMLLHRSPVCELLAVNLGPDVCGLGVEFLKLGNGLVALSGQFGSGFGGLFIEPKVSNN